MKTKLIELPGELRVLQQQPMIGGASIYRNGTKFTHVVLIAAIGLQTQTSPAIASTESRFRAAGNPMTEGAASSRVKISVLAPKVVASIKAVDSVEETAQVLTDLSADGLRVVMDIPVAIRSEGDSHVASFVDANINASGDTTEEAMDNLRDMISLMYRIWNELPASKLGKEPVRQLAVLKKFIKMAN